MVTKKIFESLDMPAHLPLNSPEGLLHTDFLCNFMPDEICTNKFQALQAIMDRRLGAGKMLAGECSQAVGLNPKKVHIFTVTTRDMQNNYY